MIEYLKKNKRIVLIILVIAFIELSGYGILASLSRLLNVFGAVGETRTLMGKPTRPSTVPVYQFQHDRFNNATINE